MKSWKNYPCLLVLQLLWLSTAMAQAPTANHLTYHGTGDSDHADAVFANFAGVGFGSAAQLAVDGHFLLDETTTEASTNLSASFRFFDVVGLGTAYRFGRKQGAAPRIVSLSLSDGETWSFAQRWSQSDDNARSDFATMFRPSHWLSFGAILHGSIVDGQWKTPLYEVV